MNSVTTLCFGRFLIDVPAGAHIRELGQQATIMYGEIRSESLSGGVEAFTKKMAARELDARKGKNPKDYQFVEVKKTAVPNTRIFISSDDVFGEKLFRLEMYHWDSGILYSLAQGPYEEEKIGRIVQGLETSLIAHLRPRAQGEIPSEPGFCFKDGFVANDGVEEHFEEARMQINFKEWPDVWVSVYSQTVPKAGDLSLLQRLAQHPDSSLEKANIKTFRQRKREVNGFKGEEVLDLLPTEEGIKQHLFTWEAVGAVKNIFAPLLSVEFETATLPPNGPRPRPSLTDDQAIKLYDTIVNSIRLRPTKAVPRTSAVEPPKTPLGELAATGHVCPETGWWQCSEPGNIVGGRRQHFKAGEQLPSAIIRGEPTVWQKFKGERPTYSMATVWQLTGYDQGEPNDPTVAALPNTDVDVVNDGKPSVGS
ncbi:hypothetical protein RugamoR57_57280 [Duganella caerulea]